jgi:hypothetical protein
MLLKAMPAFGRFEGFDVRGAVLQRWSPAHFWILSRNAIVGPEANSFAENTASRWS